MFVIKIGVFILNKGNKLMKLDYLSSNDYIIIGIVFLMLIIATKGNEQQSNKQNQSVTKVTCYDDKLQLVDGSEMKSYTCVYPHSFNKEINDKRSHIGLYNNPAYLYSHFYHH